MYSSNSQEMRHFVYCLSIVYKEMTMKTRFYIVLHNFIPVLNLSLTEDYKKSLKPFVYKCRKLLIPREIFMSIKDFRGCWK
jgi:hypothetical protein